MIYFSKLNILPYSGPKKLFRINPGDVIFAICENLLTESHPDIACIARSKQLIGNPNSEANRCIGVYISDCHQHQFWNMSHIRIKISPQHQCLARQWLPCSKRIVSQRNLIYANIFVVAIKINSVTTLACYTICCTVKICQINGFKGG